MSIGFSSPTIRQTTREVAIIHSACVPIWTANNKCSTRKQFLRTWYLHIGINTSQVINPKSEFHNRSAIGQFVSTYLINDRTRMTSKYYQCSRTTAADWAFVNRMCLQLIVGLLRYSLTINISGLIESQEMGFYRNSGTHTMYMHNFLLALSF